MEHNMEENMEFNLLCNYQVKRLETYNKYKEFIDNLENGKKQKRYRQYLKSVLTVLSHAKDKDNKLVDNFTMDDLKLGKVKPFFTTVDDDYEVINKFGRGMWDEHSIRSGFNLAEQDIIIEIAKGYGAFDY
jgi:hypothetical protein